MVVYEADSIEAYEETKASEDRLIVVDYSATWCGPCRFVAPKFAALSEQYPEAVFLHVDIDELAELDDIKDVSGVPTFKFFRNGELLERFSGANVAKIEMTLQKLY